MPSGSRIRYVEAELYGNPEPQEAVSSALMRRRNQAILRPMTEVVSNTWHEHSEGGSVWTGWQ